MEGFLVPAGVTLAVTIGVQTVILGLYLAWREPGQIGRLLRHWRATGLISVTGFMGSVCWFSAMTLQNAAYVRALGQIELVFTFITSRLLFREETSAREVTGVALVVCGLLILVLGG